jgi:S-formylglutathione hydrolase FrmB
VTHYRGICDKSRTSNRRRESVRPNARVLCHQHLGAVPDHARRDCRGRRQIPDRLDRRGGEREHARLHRHLEEPSSCSDGGRPRSAWYVRVVVRPDRTDRWQELAFESDALRDNPLGDPNVRPLFVWTPPSYEAEPDRRYPSVYVIQGMTGIARAWFNVRPWETSFPEAVSELAPEAIIVLVDTFTALGGSQFLDAPAIGRYHTYLCDEIVPWIDANFRTLDDRDYRGIQGKSSGGYGAMVTPMLRPDLFGALATHAGDALFDVTYTLEFPAAARALRDRYDGSFDRFWEDFRSGRPVLANREDPVLVNTYAMAAAYSSTEDGKIELPFDVETGALRPEVLERWLRWDPVRMAREPAHADALRGMRAIWIDSGKSDEYYLDLGATAFRRVLAEIGVPDEVVRFELFDGRHGGISWRYPLSLAFLVEHLAP